VNDERIAEIEKLCENATPGPWEAWRAQAGESPISDDSVDAVWSSASSPHRRVAMQHHRFSEAMLDMEFIAMARSAVPELLAELRREREKNAALETLIACLIERGCLTKEKPGWFIADPGGNCWTCTLPNERALLDSIAVRGSTLRSADGDQE
jgi:hypothetical protein